MNNSRDRLRRKNDKKASDLTVPIEVDLNVCMYYGFNASAPVLRDGLLNGGIYNALMSSIQKTSINQPFVESLLSTVSSVRRFVQDGTNGTSKVGDTYTWSSSIMFDFNLTTSRVRAVVSFCYEMLVFFPDQRTDRITWIVYHSEIEGSYRLFVFASEYGSPLCYKGDSLVLRGPGDNSQRIIRTSSYHLPLTIVGPISKKDCNLGNIKPIIYFVR